MGVQRLNEDAIWAAIRRVVKSDETVRQVATDLAIGYNTLWGYLHERGYRDPNGGKRPPYRYVYMGDGPDPLDVPPEGLRLGGYESAPYVERWQPDLTSNDADMATEEAPVEGMATAVAREMTAAADLLRQAGAELTALRERVAELEQQVESFWQVDAARRDLAAAAATVRQEIVIDDAPIPG